MYRMAKLRYLLLLSAMALTLIQQLTCHPHSWNHSLQPDNPDLLSTDPSQDTNNQAIGKVKGNQFRKSTSLLAAPRKDTHDQIQVKGSLKSTSNPVSTAQSLDITDQTTKQGHGRGTTSRKSRVPPTSTPSSVSNSQTKTALSGNSDSVSTTQDKDTSSQAIETVITIPASNATPLSKTKDANSQVVKRGGATESNGQAPLSTDQNTNLNAVGLGTSGQAIKSSYSPCLTKCICEYSQGGLNITIRDCETDPSHALHSILSYALALEVNIVNAKLATFPCEVLQTLVKLRTLRLWKNNIKTVSCNLTKITDLRFLDMSWNELETSPNLTLGSQLDTLLLSHNKLSVVSRSVYQSANNLDLSHNFITDLDGLLYIINILNLNLSHNLFESIPLIYSGLLVTLDLGHNNITSGMYIIGLKLVLTHNQFTEIPLGMGHLRELDMSHNALHSLSGVTDDSWAALTVLDVSHNSITEITCNMSRFILTKINLSYNALETLPCNLSVMTHLTILNLSHNSLKSGGCNLSALPSLESLDLNNNNLTVIPFDPSAMPSLTHVDFSYNQLATVSSTLLMMPSLQHLAVRNNALKTLLNAPSMVPSLQWLDLSHNSLQTVPFDKTKFKSLQMLNLSNNSLQNVSTEALLSLSSVSEIYLENNEFQRLPDDIRKVRLGIKTHLHLSGNPWICDCSGLTTRDWIGANSQFIQDSLMITCSAPNLVKGKSIVTTDPNVFCPNNSQQEIYTTIYALVGVATLLLACFSLVCVLRTRNNVEVHQRKAWEPMRLDEAEDEGKEFDVFVLYANEDEEYVGEYLIPELEARGFKVCFHRVHFLGGKSIIDNICECMAKSKKMLAFYSHDYIKSNFGMYEFNLAMELDAQNATTLLVTIKDTDVDIQNLQITHLTYFTTKSYIIREERRFWDNLVYTLPQHRMGIVEDPDDEN